MPKGPSGAETKWLLLCWLWRGERIICAVGSRRPPPALASRRRAAWITSEPPHPLPLLLVSCLPHKLPSPTSHKSSLAAASLPSSLSFPDYPSCSSPISLQHIILLFFFNRAYPNMESLIYLFIVCSTTNLHNRDPAVLFTVHSRSQSRLNTYTLSE